MKHTDYVRKLANDLEYLAAVESLELNFALSKAVVRGRIQKGWSQTELARRVGTRQANISRIESGLANPTLDLIHRLLKALDLDIQFIGGAVTESAKTINFAEEAIQVQNWPVKMIAESSISEYQVTSGDLK